MSESTANRAPVAPEPTSAAPADTTAAPAADGTLPGVAPDAPPAFPPGADAADRIRAVLTAAGPDGVTAAHIAETAHVARSTVSKILARYAEIGTARREVGGFVGRSRQPDRWHRVTASDEAASPTAEATTATGGDGSEPTAAATPAAPGAGPQNGPDAKADSAPDTGPATPAAPDTPTPPDGADSGPDTAPVAPVVPAPAGPDTGPEPGPGALARLGPGALRGMVFDHMNTRPGQEFTPGQIGRALGGRSSGAVANACDKLTADGLVELTCDKPRRFRVAAASAAAATAAPVTGTDTEPPATD